MTNGELLRDGMWLRANARAEGAPSLDKLRYAQWLARHGDQLLDALETLFNVATRTT